MLETYKDTQFRLLMEDFAGPKGIQELRNYEVINLRILLYPHLSTFF